MDEVYICVCVCVCNVFKVVVGLLIIGLSDICVGFVVERWGG